MFVYNNSDVSAPGSAGIFSALPIAAIIIDKEGKIEQANTAAGDLLRENPEYLIGRRFLSSHWKMVDAKGSPLISDNDFLLTMAEEKRVNTLEVGIVFEEGITWLSVHTSPLISEEGEYQGAIANILDNTEKKNTEKKLQQREQRLLSITESQSNYVVRTDLEGNFIYLNSTLLTHLGYEQEELLYQPLDRITNRADAIRSIKAAAYCLSHPGKQRPIEIRCRNKQREYFWTSWELTGITDDQGEVIELQAVGQDISKKKRIADLLVETSQMARVGGWEINGLTKQLSWTPETYRIHDVPENSPITLRRVINFYHPDHQPVIRRAIRRLISRGEPLDLQLKVITEQKREVWVRVIGQRDSLSGNYVRAFGVIQDITASQKSKERIKEREWLLKSIFNSTADALFLTNLEGKLIDCNLSALRVFEINKKDDFIGLEVDTFQKDPFTEQESHSIQKKIAETGVWTGEVEFISAQSKSFWGNMAITAVDGADYCVIRVTDITDQKQAEALLIESNENLKKTNQELDRFVYSASHDLRAPLTSILGLIQLSEMEEMNNSVQEYLRHMKKSANRLDTFIKDLTHFSRNARVELAQESIDFDEMIHMLFEQYQFMDFEAPVATQKQVEQQCPFYSDKNRLQIVLGNIISNALKYTLQKESSLVKVVISVNPEEAVIQIIDNGMGIDPSHVDKIFDMFYRANDYKPGSGLGLYIVKESVEKLKGTIKVNSTLGKGTRFTLILPNLGPANRDVTGL